jgi:hypothetical protein
MVIVHYAKAPIIGDYVLPWDELPEDLREGAGHLAKVHEAVHRDQWHSYRVYVHRLLSADHIFQLGTTYSTPESYVYEVLPVGFLGPDPERDGHLITSRTCDRSLVLRCLNNPADGHPEYPVDGS